MRRTISVLLGLLLLGSASARAQTTWYVNASNPNCPGSGTVGNPFCTIQAAIDASLSGDTIRVLPGTYAKIDYKGKEIEIASTAGAATTIIDGGFSWAGCAATAGQCPGSAVVFASQEGPGAILRGLTVRNGGQGTDLGGTWAGAGILCLGSSPTIVDCVIRDCLAFAPFLSGTVDAKGGGVYSQGGLPHLSGCVLQDNQAMGVIDITAWGGGIYGPAILEECVLIGNFTELAGGGAAFCTLIDCVIAGNTTRVWQSHGPITGLMGGGGAFNCVLVDCEIKDNVASFQRGQLNGYDTIAGGGALSCDLQSCLVKNNLVLDTSSYLPITGDLRGGGLSDCIATDCTLQGNTVQAGGTFYGPSLGGGAADSTLVRCTLFENTADRGGGCAASTVTGCTLYANTARELGGGVSIADPMADSVCSSILWKNVPDQAHASGSTQISFSDIGGSLWPGVGNISADPKLWDPWNADFHLRPGSPCIGTGSSICSGAPDIDMGALPFHLPYCAPPLIYCTAKTSSAGCLPAVSHSGSPSLSDPAPLKLHASNVANMVLGILFYGKQGPLEVPFQGGWLCVAAPLIRTPVQSSGGSPSGSDCTGTLGFSFEAYVLSGFDPALVVGAHVSCQLWFRDPPAPFGTGLTNAVRFVICQ